MSATCAACLRPIRSRQDLVIAGTEVLHRACARGGIQTELARVRECLASANADRARALREKDSITFKLEHANDLLRELTANRNQWVATDAVRRAALHDAQVLVQDLRAQLARRAGRAAQSGTRGLRTA
jgi:hypothetical protein